MPLFINKVMLAGNLTRDPQVKFLANNTAVCEFGLAINKRYKDKNGEQQEEVTFVDVSCFGRTAELVGQYLTKGRNCFIEGSLKLDQWEDKDGQRRSKIKVVAQNVNFIGGEAKAQERPGEEPFSAPRPTPSVPTPADLGDDEPPF